jgi:hypothetical protein
MLMIANDYKQKKINEARKKINELCPPWLLSTPTSVRLVDGESPFPKVRISQEKPEYAIASFKISISLVPDRTDRTDYRKISHLTGRGGTTIFELFNQMYEERIYPVVWPQYEIFFRKKAGGVNLRPISLASSLCKLLEKMVNNRFRWWLEHH